MKRSSFKCFFLDVPVSRHREVAQSVFMDNVMGFADVSLLELAEYSFMRNSVSTSNLDLSSRKSMVRISNKAAIDNERIFYV